MKICNGLSEDGFDQRFGLPKDINIVRFGDSSRVNPSGGLTGGVSGHGHRKGTMCRLGFLPRVVDASVNLGARRLILGVTRSHRGYDLR